MQLWEKLKKQLSSRLFLRLFSISLIFMVIPLLVHSFLMYDREYKQRVNNLFFNLYLIGQNDTLLVTKIFALQNELLTNNQEFSNKYVDIRLIPLNADLEAKILKNPFIIEKDEIHTGKIIKDKGILWSTLNIRQILEDLQKADIEASNYPIMVSLLVDDKYIGVALPPILSTKKVPKINNAFFLHRQGMTTLALKNEIKNTPYNLMLEVDEAKIVALHKGEYFGKIISLFLTIVGIGGIIVFLLSWRMAKPLEELSSVMHDIASGKMDRRFEKDPFGFEVNVLGQTFNETVHDLLTTKKQELEARLKKEGLEKELNIGREIQFSLLPSQLPEIPALQISTSYLPAKEVSGDFYDIFKIGNELIIAISDVAGKGVPACLYSLSLRSMLRSFCFRGWSLHDALLATNALFLKDCEESGTFATLWIGSFNIEQNTLRYCSCGHPPALLKKGEKILQLQTKGMALGVSIWDALEIKEVTLESGDFLLLYTDGVTEAQNMQEELFGIENLQQFMTKQNNKTAQEISQGLILRLNQFSKGALQNDDIALLVLKIL